ncbi:LIM and calponin homology domains-containing protein isoform 3 [Schistosoma japonicum]|uniref:LIM and calponin homology domains-containing protein isoform 3 n=1 Tax=Schistosoma japonicum TaxID=6182 RepID=A0A4Z2DMP8_SCHJA|nr:LIM and calponin homology domains-containing protein isoform 3 [Schistosoma japonicum]
MSLSHSTSPNFGEKPHFKINDQQQSLPGVEYLQGNNSGFEEEEEWQSKLDVWREKRRQALRTEATKFALLQEHESKENERRREEVKDRLRKVKNQRNLISSGHVSPLDLTPPPKINSPGVALLTGSDLDPPTISYSEKGQMDTVTASQSISLHRFQYIENESFPNLKISETDLNGHSNRSSPVSELKTDVQSNSMDRIIDVSPLNKNSSEKYPKCDSIEIVRDSISKPTGESGNAKLTLSPEKKVPADMSFKYDDYSECKLRLSSRHGVSEVHWGLTIKAEGPSNTFPFIVERVKIGSSADICEFQKGDILASIDGVNLGISRMSTNRCMNQVTKLDDLEKLMVRLVLANKPITVQVFRKMDELEDINGGESDIGGDYSVESPVMKSQHTPSNTSDSDSECHEVLVSQTGVVSREASPVDTPVLQRSITITHALHRSPSQSSIQISDNEVNNSSVSTNSEGKEYNCQKGYFDISSKSSDIINRIQTSPHKSSQNKPKNAITNPTEIEVFSSTPTPVDLANCSNTSNCKQNVKVTLMAPNSFALATSSMLSPCIQASHRIRPPISVMEDTKLPDFINEITRTQYSTVSKSYSQTASPNVVRSLITSTFPNETKHPSSSPKTRHSSQQRTFHIHPRLPEVWDDVPLHTVDGQGSFSPNYKQNLMYNAPPQSYLLYNTNLSKPELDSSRPRVPPRPIPKTSYTPPQLSQFTTTAETDSLPSILSSSNQSRLTKSDLSSSTTKSKSSRASELDTHVNNSKTRPQPQPVALLSENKLKQLSQDSLNSGDKHSVNEVIFNDYQGSERSPVKRNLSSSNEDKGNLSPIQNFEAEAPPIPPRTPRVQIVDNNQLCAACNAKLDCEDSMVIESLNLYYHLPCFVCARCGVALGDGLSDVEVRVRRNSLYCSKCHSKNLITSKCNKSECYTKTRQQKPPRPTDKRHRNDTEQQMSANLNKK